MKSLLITGGTGFVGRHVLKYLPHDIQISILTRKKLLSDERVTYLFGDIANARDVERAMKMSRPDMLLHLAWNVKGERYACAEENRLWVDWTKHLAQTFFQQGGRIFVGSGTCFEYDLAYRGDHVEDEVCHPLTLYGECKLETMRIVSELSERHDARFVWGRIFYPYGRGEESRKLFSSVLTTWRKGETFVCKSPDSVLDYIHIEDVARHFTAFLQNEQIQGIVNVSAGKGASVRKMLQTLAQASGCEKMLSFSNEGEDTRIVGSTEKARKYGIFCRHTLASGICDMLDVE